jgi:hypothetical protein
MMTKPLIMKNQYTGSRPKSGITAAMAVKSLAIPALTQSWCRSLRNF